MANEMQPPAPDTVQCPVCFKDFTAVTVNEHLDVCLLKSVTDGSPSTKVESEPPVKKCRVSAEYVNRSMSSTSSSSMAGTQSAVFSLFQNKGKPAIQSDRSSLFTSKQSPVSAFSKGGKRALPKAEFESASPVRLQSQQQPTTMPKEKTSETEDFSPQQPFALDKPLAEILRPNTLEEYFGQNKVVGQQTLVRSLLDTHEIPSLILWGPPGCGKTTLAHIIASNSKKRGTARFVTLSATSASVNEVREVIKQAQNELRLCKRKTILFIDEIHRFNKSQQDTFLPHVECGTITLIGATTENPSFQVNAALLSRCRVLVLEKLSVEAMGSILKRAVAKLGFRIREQGPASPKDEDQTNGHELNIYIEQEALDTIAYLCDGDARTGLNGLQLAVQAQINLTRTNLSTQDSTSQEIVVTEEHVKEGLQRSHILYDKAASAAPIIDALGRESMDNSLYKTH